MPIAMWYLLGSSLIRSNKSMCWFFFSLLLQRRVAHTHFILCNFIREPEFNVQSKFKWALRAIRLRVFYDDDKSWTCRIIHLLTERVCKQATKKIASNGRFIAICYWLFLLIFFYLHNKNVIFVLNRFRVRVKHHCSHRKCIYHKRTHTTLNRNSLALILICSDSLDYLRPFIRAIYLKYSSFFLKKILFFCTIQNKHSFASNYVRCSIEPSYGWIFVQ